jgi:3',5'-nucleoside bisphosphate phosphatase
MDLIDLQAHSTASDGSLTPSEIVQLARKSGLRAVALTDHDTLDGLQEALNEGQVQGVEVIPGVEISAEFKEGTMHILGYYVWDGRASLSQSLIKLQHARAERNPRMISKLNELGFKVSLEEVIGCAGGGQVGRPHMARALLEKGYISNISEAFDLYLGKGKPAYEEKFRFPPDEAISMIRTAGGVPVLAHPFTLGLDDRGLDSLVTQLVLQGLEGIEVLSPEHATEQERFYRKLALDHNLVITGGTDFHGVNKPGIDLGKGRGSFRVPYALLDPLKERHDRILRGK